MGGKREDVGEDDVEMEAGRSIFKRSNHYLYVHIYILMCLYVLFYHMVLLHIFCSLPFPLKVPKKTRVLNLT